MTNTEHPSEQRLQELLEIYGANKARWPAPYVEPLELWLKNSIHARELYKQAKEIDRRLNTKFETYPAPAYLLGAVLANAQALQSTSGSWRDLLQIFSLKPLGGLMAAALLGIFLGWYSPNIMLPNADLNFDEVSLSDTVLEWEADG